MLAMGRELQKVFKTPEMAGRNILRKFLLEVKRIYTMPSSLVWKLLYFNKPTPFPHRLATDTIDRRGLKRRKSSGAKSVEGKTKKRK